MIDYRLGLSKRIAQPRSCRRGPQWLYLGACLALVLLSFGQVAVFACVDSPLVAKIRHNVTLDVNSWRYGNVVVCVGTTVHFLAVDWYGNVASTVDLDVPVGNGCNYEQKTDTAFYNWDFDYHENDPNYPNEPSIDADGVGLTNGVFDVSMTFTTPGVYTVRLDVDDDADEAAGDENPLKCLHDEDPVYDEITVTVVAPDIDTDSDNDGLIESEDDAIEESYPGKYVEIDGELAEVDLGGLPSTTGSQMRLQATGGIAVYSYANGTGLLDPLPIYTIGVDSIPPHVYVKGVSAGPATLEWVSLDGSQNPACTDTVRFAVVASLPDEGLPDANLNNVVGRCNIRWASVETDTGYAGRFTLPTGTWTVDRIRMWAVPAVPVSPTYHLGDHYSSITLCAGSTDTLTQVATGTLTADSNETSNSNITCTPVTYPDAYPVGQDYQQPDGTYDQIWQIDFKNLNLALTGGATVHKCGMYGVPRVDRLWFTHATTVSSGEIWPMTISTRELGDVLDDGSGWFGGSESNINVQVFYH